MGRSATVLALTLMMGAPLSVFAVAAPAAAHIDDAAYEGHYWIGGEFLGTEGDVNIVQAEITVPTMYPNSADQYYVMLSIWDNADMYDQIGFSGWNGAWGVTWAGLNCDVSNNNFNRNAYTLTRGQTYIFQMQIGVNGDVGWSVTNLQTMTIVWTRWENHAGANDFLREHLTDCAGGGLGYTVYEEPYTVHDQEIPSWNFEFAYIAAEYVPTLDWNPWAVADSGESLPSTSNQPDPIVIVGSDPNNGNVVIWNQWFGLRSDWHAGITIEQGTTSWYDNAAYNVLLNPDDIWSTDCGSSCDVTLDFESLPPSWSGMLDDSQETPPWAVELT